MLKTTLESTKLLLGNFLDRREPVYLMIQSTDKQIGFNGPDMVIWLIGATQQADTFTLSRTTNFRLVQTERQQFPIY